MFFFFFSSRRRHTRYWRDWSSDVCSSDLGARLHGVQIDKGTATVELSGTRLAALPGAARRWPLQALVHTLTQFPTVRRVLVRADGRPVSKPLGRDTSLRLAPIALAEPAPGALVKGDQLVVKGEASVYEGTVSLRLRDDHR